MKVMVEIQEVHSSFREIEVADNATNDEIRKAVAENAGEADEIRLEYSYTLEPDTWTIRKDNGDSVQI